MDGRLVLDAWRDQPPTIHRVELDLSAGNHAIRMEYYESYGGALARLGWQGIGGGPGPGNTWRGEYFANRTLSGAPTFSRLDPKVSFDWGFGSPDPRLPDDNFSSRRTRTVQFSSGRYRFTTVTDDGLRLLVDGRAVIDQWHDMGRETYTADVQLSAGPHTIQMDYYEAAGAASAVLGWVKMSDTRRDVGEHRYLRPNAQLLGNGLPPGEWRLAQCQCEGLFTNQQHRVSETGRHVGGCPALRQPGPPLQG
jgi:hypothetical protein